ncbi:MAG: hypothetical protein WCZ90_15575 [Melioribacteraceae bacterium]
MSCQKNIKPEEAADLNKNKTDSIVSKPMDIQNEVDYNLLYKLESYLTSEKIDTNKLQNIDSSCAILVYPTDIQTSN